MRSENWHVVLYSWEETTAKAAWLWAPLKCHRKPAPLYVIKTAPQGRRKFGTVCRQPPQPHLDPLRDLGLIRFLARNAFHNSRPPPTKSRPTGLRTHSRRTRFWQRWPFNPFASGPPWGNLLVTTYLTARPCQCLAGLWHRVKSAQLEPLKHINHSSGSFRK